MRIKVLNLVVVTLVLSVGIILPEARANSASDREHQVKAAFLYNFINFVEWPKDKLAEEDTVITIGIIGKDPFGKAFEPIKNKKVKGKKVIVRRFGSYKELKGSSEQIKSVRQCHILFICSSEKENLKEVIGIVENHSVLTVGDMKSFLESDGIINFLMEDNKVRFEVNKTAAERAKLKIRSKLLRLAKRVIPK